MTQTELEQVARRLSDIGLYAWSIELMVLADGMVGNMGDVYKTLVRNFSASNNVSLILDNNVYMTLHEKLYKAIVSLTGEGMLAGWGSEVGGSDI